MNTFHQSWSKPLPHPPSAIAVAPSGRTIVAATAFGNETGSVGSLTVLDADTGDTVRQVVDDWHVFSVTFAPDGLRMAIAEHRAHYELGQEEWRTRVVAVDSGAELTRYTGRKRAGQLTYGPDGTWIAVVGQVAPDPPFPENFFCVWVFDANTGAERWARGLAQTAVLACRADSNAIAIAFHDGITVVDAAHGVGQLVIPMPAQATAVAYSSDGRRIVAGTVDGRLCVFDAADGSQLWAVQVHGDFGPVQSVAVSADGRWTTGLGTSAPLGIYDIESGTPKFPPTPMTGGTQVRYSPTLRHLISNARYGPPPAGPYYVPYGLSVVDARNGRNDADTGQYDVMQLDCAPDGRWVVIGQHTDPTGIIERYDLGIEVSRYAIGGSLTDIVLSATGTPLVAVADTGAAVTVIAADSGTRLVRKPIPGTIAAITFADSGQAIVAGGSGGVRLSGIVGDRYWKVDGIGAVNALTAVGPAGDWIACAAGRSVQLLSSTDGHARWGSANIHPQAVTRIAASTDGTWIASGCADRGTRVLTAVTGTQIFLIEGDGKVQSLAFQPNRSLLATGNEDGTVVLIDAATATQRARLTHGVGCRQLAFSADTTLLAASWDDNVVSIYDLTDVGAPVKVRDFTCPAPISGLKFNPTDGTVAVAVAGGTLVTVRDPHTGIEQARLPHPEPVREFAVGADGALTATTSDDGVVRVWTIEETKP
ncbi:WD40 repeat domain-containing protein [Nocardia tengchongensis]|uniref:WD40 repeat domain-containing protein n=1 Tax=Nocardia tengchongensis TaxID=2055889 RepID=UPI003692EBC2